MLTTLQRLVPFSILSASLLLRWWDPAVLIDLRHLTFDQFQRIAPRPYLDQPVRIIDIDDQSLSKYGQWPWPRSLVATLIEDLSRQGAAAIALDVIFPERDRTAPDEIAKIWGLRKDDPNLKALQQTLKDPDLSLKEAIAKGPTVLGFVLTNEATSKPKKKGSFAIAGRNPLTLLHRFKGAIASLDMLQESASGNGSINVIPDRDGIVRQVPLLVAADQDIYGSLAAEALRVAQGEKTYIVKSSGAQGHQSIFDWLKTGIGEIRIGAFIAKTDQSGELWLHDTGHRQERYVPAWKILEDQPIDLKGRIVLIGTSAPGLNDLRATPNQPVIPGVEIHAQAIEQILTHDFLIRSAWSNEIEMATLLMMGMAMIFLLPRTGPLGCAILGGLVVGITSIAAIVFYRDYGLLFDPLYPAIASLAVYMAGLLLSYQRSDAERKRVRDAFSHYLAPEMVKRLAQDASDLKLGGEIRTISLLFCDIRDFTSIAEGMDAEEATGFLNSFLTPMTESVLQHKGTIDKYIGDSIMAFWNAPIDDPHHARNAFDAALTMRRELATLNAALPPGTSPIRMGIGINTGPCCVGNLGSAQRFNYSAMGDEVNLASRIEGITKSYGLDILIAQSAKNLAPHYATIEIGDVPVRGKALPVRLYALIGDADLAKQPIYPSLARSIQQVAMALNERKIAEAREYLRQAEELAQGLELEALIAHIDASIHRLEGFTRAFP